eukprot:4656778-Pyramimonas_sp.AAC.1
MLLQTSATILAEVSRMREESVYWGSFSSNTARTKGPAGMLRIDGARITQDPEHAAWPSGGGWRARPPRTPLGSPLRPGS